MKMRLFGIAKAAALLLVLLALGGCAMLSSIDGTVDPHGWFTGNGSAGAVSDGAQELGSYSTILGIVDTGYAEYAAKVKEAQAAGKKVSSITRWYVFLFTTTAYAR